MEPIDPLVERVLKDALLPRSENTAKISINAGGVGVWVAVTACLVMLGIMMVREFQIAQNFARIESQMKELRENDSAHDAWIQVINNTKQDKGRQ